MWRSFFYAAGIGLLILGVESLVLDHVVTARKLRLPTSIKKMLIEDGGQLATATGNRVKQLGNGIGQTVGYPSGNVSLGNGQPLSGRTQSRVDGGVYNGSRFGPSRFSGPTYGHYGGSRINGANGNSRFTSGGNPNNKSVNRFGGNYSQANYSTGSNVGSQPNRTIAAPPGRRLIKTKEWMPWCFLAAGTIVILYTNSWRPRVD